MLKNFLKKYLTNLQSYVIMEISSRGGRPRDDHSEEQPPLFAIFIESMRVSNLKQLSVLLLLLYIPLQ